MNEAAEALAFFLEEAEMRQIFRGWPEAIRLAVCLDRSGGCAMLVFHRAEDDRILRRIAELLQMPAGGFHVVPERKGYPARRMLFSEEQAIIGLVAETDALVETASDYAINYAFALEEGLDVELLTTGKAAAGSSARITRESLAAAGVDLWLAEPAVKDGAVRPGEGRAAVFSHRRPGDAAPAGAGVAGAGVAAGGRAAAEAPEAASRPAASPRGTPPEPVADAAAHAGSRSLPDGVPGDGHDMAGDAAGGWPKGFRPLDSAARRHAVFGEGVLASRRPGLLSLLARGAGGTPAAFDSRAQVIFRDDLLGFALPFAGFGGVLGARLPEQIVLSAHLFPAALVAALEEAPLPVRLTGAEGYLYVTLEGARAEAAARDPDGRPGGVSTGRGPGRSGARPVVPPAPGIVAGHPRRRAMRGKGMRGRLLRGGIGGGALLVAALILAQISLSPAFSGADNAHAKRQSLRDDVFGALVKK